MSRYLNLRVGINVAVILLTVFLILPNFVNISPDSVWGKSKLRLGLDIQGGSHLVMGVDVNEVLDKSVANLAQTLKNQFEDEKIAVQSVQVNPNNKREIVIEHSADMSSRIADTITRFHGTTVVSSGTPERTTVQYQELYAQDLKKRTVDQAIETIRNRIDEFGVSEPSITAQGEDRILIQLPGVEDAAHAKDLINRTARLEFMIVDTSVPMDQLAKMIEDTEKAKAYSLDDMKYSEYVRRLNEDLKSQLPPNTTVRFEKAPEVTDIKRGKIPYLLRTDTGLGGDKLRNAGITYDPQFNTPQVSLEFDADGARRFADITGANVNKQMAIVLDDVIYSAPNINSRIDGGNAVITLGRSTSQDTFNEARTISMALRAGALPARLEQLEERTVGPSLGADSIANGVKASIVGGVLIFIFMILYYKGCGIVADISLLLNVSLILAILTMLDATLTLPGIAGAALTIGMAVDANIIIFERIKEEMAKGAEFASALSSGYEKAFSAIFDSNITTAFTSIILIYYGTGPVKGFGVTLLIGIMSSLFSAVFFTRTIFDLLVSKFGIKKIWI